MCGTCIYVCIYVCMYTVMYSVHVCMCSCLYLLIYLSFPLQAACYGCGVMGQFAGKDFAPACAGMEHIFWWMNTQTSLHKVLFWMCSYTQCIVSLTFSRLCNFNFALICPNLWMNIDHLCSFVFFCLFVCLFVCLFIYLFLEFPAPQELTQACGAGLADTVIPHWDTKTWNLKCLLHKYRPQ